MGLMMAAPAAAEDPTADSAVWLLRQATMVRQDRSQNVMLRALRQMRDPKLEPLFSELIQRRSAELRIHGILGLGELSEPRQIDLRLVQEVEQPAVQAQLVSVALASDLIDAEASRKIVAWPGGSAAVKMLVAIKLVGEGDVKDVDEIREMLTESEADENESLHWTAALLRLQLGDKSAMDELNKLEMLDNPQRNIYRALLLTTMVSHQYDKAAPWALRIASEPGISRSMFFSSLRAAMMGGAPGAEDLWLERYNGSDSVAEQMHLALLAINLAEDLEPRVFEAMSKSDQGVIRHMAEAGLAITRGEPAEESILELIEENHMPSNDWALRWASEQEPEVARPVLVGLIYAASGGPPRNLSQRQQHAVFATQQFIENDPQAAVILRNLLSEADDMMQEVILMGMIRANEGDPDKVIDGMDDWPTRTSRSMALLIRAKYGGTLDEKELDDLGVVVRGGGGVADPLRLQAAWSYLKQTNQQQVALASVLKRH